MAYTCPDCHIRWLCTQIKLNTQYDKEIDEWLDTMTVNGVDVEVGQECEVRFTHRLVWVCEECNEGEINIWISGLVSFRVKENWNIGCITQGPENEVMENSGQHEEGFEYIV